MTLEELKHMKEVCAKAQSVCSDGENSAFDYAAAMMDFEQSFGPAQVAELLELAEKGLEASKPTLEEVTAALRERQ